MNKIKKINFFCIGAQKAGTTTLHDVLNQHPDLYLPPGKEVPFFDVNERYEKGINYFFETRYNTYKNEKLVGNINPNLQLELRSIDRIIETFDKNVKIVFILRNPVKRSYSHYLMSKRRGHEKLAFLDALTEEENRINNPKKHKDYITKELSHYEKNHFGYVNRSMYSEMIEYLYQNFEKENIKIILFEEFIKNKEPFVKEILEFLNLNTNIEFNFSLQSNPGQTPKSTFLTSFLHNPSKFKTVLKKLIPFKSFRQKIKNQTNSLNLKTLDSSQKKMTDETYAQIEKYFVEDIKKTEKLINKDLSAIWKN